MGLRSLFEGFLARSSTASIRPRERSSETNPRARIRPRLHTRKVKFPLNVRTRVRDRPRLRMPQRHRSP